MGISSVGRGGSLASSGIIAEDLRIPKIVGTIIQASQATTQAASFELDDGWVYSANVVALSDALAEDSGALSEEIAKIGLKQVLENRGLFSRIAGNLRILRALEGTKTKLTLEEINNLVDFIEKRHGKTGYDGVYRSKDYNICRTVEITPDGEIYIHLNRLSKGDTLIGKGASKKAKIFN